MEWVSVVVVLTGLRTVVSSVVVVVLCESAAFFSFTVVQADRDAKATAARQGRISFFICMILFLFDWLFNNSKLRDGLVIGYGV